MSRVMRKHEEKWFFVSKWEEKAAAKWYEECVRAFPDRDHFWAAALAAFFHCDNSVIECMYVRRAELLALRNFLDGLSVMIKAFSQLSKAHKMELRAAEAIEARTTKILQKSSPRNKKESRIDTIFSLSPWICAKKFKTFFVVVTLFSENLVVLDDIYKSSSAAGQKILAVSMQDTSAFAIRNSSMKGS